MRFCSSSGISPVCVMLSRALSCKLQASVCRRTDFRGALEEAVRCSLTRDSRFEKPTIRAAALERVLSARVLREHEQRRGVCFAGSTAGTVRTPSAIRMPIKARSAARSNLERRVERIFGLLARNETSRLTTATGSVDRRVVEALSHASGCRAPRSNRPR
jgi:hypothetical protein